MELMSLNRIPGERANAISHDHPSCPVIPPTPMTSLILALKGVPLELSEPQHYPLGPLKLQSDPEKLTQGQEPEKSLLQELVQG